MKTTITILLLQAAFIGGIMARPAIEAEFKPQLAKDVSGYEAVVANIDSGEVYYGK